MATDVEKGKEIVVGSTSTTAGEASQATSENHQEQEKNKRREKAAPRKPATRSWVWDHFDKIKKPIMETIDGVEKKVGHETRAKCKYCSKDLACDSSFNGTSTLKRHIERVCKLYPGRTELEEDQPVFTSDGTPASNVVMRNCRRNHV
ncbi:hypothetical protein M0R45_016262 [Rubus argutus]|uniref:BED-type domain-containing protein n=1 Tax=Rubus argutus TaxID=59490 RepID=A0AAW1XUK1_RUBAR